MTRARPARLRPGDTVAVVAPAGPISAEEVRRGTELLRSWGLRVKVGPHVLDRHPSLDYLGGTDADRAADLQAAWCDPEVAGVLCARGGYGCLRLLDLLDWDALATAGPKLFTGSSDVTALHELFAERVGVVTLFCPMFAGLLRDEVGREHLRATLFEPGSTLVLTRPGAEALAPGTARGLLHGGNASMLAATLGARRDDKGAGVGADAGQGRLLLLEDVSEEPYRLDRIITQLLRADWFDGVTGIALGSWTSCGEPSEVRAVLSDLLLPLGVPIAWELGFGHRDGPITVPLGMPAELDADAGTLTLAEPALA